MSPLIGAGLEGLIKTPVGQILKEWISGIVVSVCLSPYLLLVSAYKSGSSLGAEIITIHCHTLSPSDCAWHRVGSQ